MSYVGPGKKSLGHWSSSLGPRGMRMQGYVADAARGSRGPGAIAAMDGASPGRRRRRALLERLEAMRDRARARMTLGATATPALSASPRIVLPGVRLSTVRPGTITLTPRKFPGVKGRTGPPRNFTQTIRPNPNAATHPFGMPPRTLEPGVPSFPAPDGTSDGTSDGTATDPGSPAYDPSGGATGGGGSDPGSPYDPGTDPGYDGGGDTTPADTTDPSYVPDDTQSDGTDGGMTATLSPGGGMVVAAPTRQAAPPAPQKKPTFSKKTLLVGGLAALGLYLLARD